MSQTAQTKNKDHERRRSKRRPILNTFSLFLFLFHSFRCVFFAQTFSLK